MSKWLCIDANLVVKLVIDPDDEVVRKLWEDWRADQRPVVAPQLLTYEVTNVLYRYQRLGLMLPSTVRAALEAALALPIQYYAESTLHYRALDLANQFSLPAAYDAHYLALAEWLESEFWTADDRLVNTVHDKLPWVHSIRDTPLS